MSMDSGFNTSGAPYEYTVAEKKDTKLIFKRITLIALYILWGTVFLLAGFALRIIVPFLAFIPLSLWILVFLTWRLTQVEYEYSFFAGTLTVSRVLGGRTRKELCNITLRTASEILPYENNYVRKIENFSAERTIFAASSEDAPNLYCLLWNDEENTRCALFFEPTEKALKIMRYYNMSAVTLKSTDQ